MESALRMRPHQGNERVQPNTWSFEELWLHNGREGTTPAEDAAQGWQAAWREKQCPELLRLGGYEEVAVTDLFKIWVLPGGLEEPRVDSTVVVF